MIIKSCVFCKICFKFHCLIHSKITDWKMQSKKWTQCTNKIWLRNITCDATDILHTFPGWRWFRNCHNDAKKTQIPLKAKRVGGKHKKRILELTETIRRKRTFFKLFLNEPDSRQSVNDTWAQLCITRCFFPLNTEKLPTSECKTLKVKEFHFRENVIHFEHISHKCSLKWCNLEMWTGIVVLNKSSNQLFF